MPPRIGSNVASPWEIAPFPGGSDSKQKIRSFFSRLISARRAAAAAFAVFAVLFATLRSPILRLIVALVFAAPAAIAGYALVHGVTHEAIPSAIWRQIFCFIGGALVGVSALMRLAGSKTTAAS